MSNIFTEQPWIADTGPIAPALSGAQIAVNSRRSALKVLLSVVTIFFLLISNYYLYIDRYTGIVFVTTNFLDFTGKKKINMENGEERFLQKNIFILVRF